MLLLGRFGPLSPTKVKNKTRIGQIGQLERQTRTRLLLTWSVGILIFFDFLLFLFSPDIYSFCVCYLAAMASDRDLFLAYGGWVG